MAEQGVAQGLADLAKRKRHAGAAGRWGFGSVVCLALFGLAYPATAPALPLAVGFNAPQAQTATVQPVAQQYQKQKKTAQPQNRQYAPPKPPRKVVVPAKPPNRAAVQPGPPPYSAPPGRRHPPALVLPTTPAEVTQFVAA